MSPSHPKSIRDSPPTPSPAHQPPATAAEGSKFTVILSPDDAAMFDQLALDIRRVLGRRVVKGDLLRALVALAGDDATLQAQIVAELRARTS